MTRPSGGERDLVDLGGMIVSLEWSLGVVGIGGGILFVPALLWLLHMVSTGARNFAGRASGAGRHSSVLGVLPKGTRIYAWPHSRAGFLVGATSER